MTEWGHYLTTNTTATTKATAFDHILESGQGLSVSHLRQDVRYDKININILTKSINKLTEVIMLVLRFKIMTFATFLFGSGKTLHNQSRPVCRGIVRSLLAKNYPVPYTRYLNPVNSIDSSSRRACYNAPSTRAFPAAAGAWGGRAS